MKYRLVIRPEAEDDLNKGFSWYEDKRIGLGFDLLLCVDAAFQFIKRIPEIHPTEYKKTRKHLIRKFPYKIVYMIEDDRIIVLGIIHTSRSQKFVKKRIDKS